MPLEVSLSFLQRLLSMADVLGNPSLNIFTLKFRRRALKGLLQKILISQIFNESTKWIHSVDQGGALGHE